ncbi:MAG: hypothetical protein ACI9EF_002931 [Pseudohongiellaceae bacterium]|jgi:hypothetical protein
MVKPGRCASLDDEQERCQQSGEWGQLPSHSVMLSQCPEDRWLRPLAVESLAVRRREGQLSTGCELSMWAIEFTTCATLGSKVSSGAVGEGRWLHDKGDCRDERSADQPLRREDASEAFLCGELPSAVGARLLRSSAGAAGAQGRIVDALVEGITAPRMARLLREKQPELVGLSTYSPTRYECFRTAALVKDVLGPGVVVVTGGSHASAQPEDTLDHVPAVDYCVRGEGGDPFAELIEALEAGTEPTHVAGVSGRYDGRIVNAPDRENIADLDALPLPARRLLPMKRYRTRMPSTMGICTTVLTTRGCPARCTFCTRDWFSRETRYRSPMEMVDEVEMIVRDYGIRGIIFQDDTFP